MYLPITPNTTCDIYQYPHLPPSLPDVPGVPCHLQERFRNIKPQTGNPTIIYDHVLVVAADVDVRDNYNGAAAPSTVFIPDSSGTQFLAVAVARVGRGTALDHKIVYLQRQAVTWPSNDV